MKGTYTFMTTSMLDQIIFNLRCGHHELLGRLANKNVWTCENCGEETDLAAGPYKAAMDRDLFTASQIDLQAKLRGGT
jgi:ribosomal protein L37AE/L43A